MKCDYFNRDAALALYQTYDETLRMIVSMINTPDSWTIDKK